MTSLGHKLLETAVLILATVALLHIAWQLLEPLVPVLAVAAVVLLAAVAALRRYRGW